MLTEFRYRCADKPRTDLAGKWEKAATSGWVERPRNSSLLFCRASFRMLPLCSHERFRYRYRVLRHRGDIFTASGHTGYYISGERILHGTVDTGYYVSGEIIYRRPTVDTGVWISGGVIWGPSRELPFLRKN